MKNKNIFTLFKRYILLTLLFVGYMGLAQTCTEPTTYQYKSVQNGSWSNGSTWEGGTAPSGSNKNVLIKHIITYSSDLKPASGTTIVIKEGGELAVNQMQTDNGAVNIILNNGKLTVDQNLQMKNVSDGICATNGSCITIGENLQFSGNSQLSFTNSGLKVGENLQGSPTVSGSANYKVWVREDMQINTTIWPQTGVAAWYAGGQNPSGWTGESTSSMVPCDYVPPCNAGTTAPTVNPAISNICPATTVNLNTQAFTGTIPSNATLQWWTTATRATGTQVSSPTAVGAGTYYAFYYDNTNNCWSPASAAVTVTINTCVPSPSCDNLYLISESRNAIYDISSLSGGSLTSTSTNKVMNVSTGANASLAVGIDPNGSGQNIWITTKYSSSGYVYVNNTATSVTSPGYGGLTANPVDGKVYSVKGGASNARKLYQVYPSYQDLGTITGDAFFHHSQTYISTDSFFDSDGKYYVLAFRAYEYNGVWTSPTKRLYSIDLNTRQATFVKTITGIGNGVRNFQGLAFYNGKIYLLAQAAGSTNVRLYEVNPDTGAASLKTSYTLPVDGDTDLASCQVYNPPHTVGAPPVQDLANDCPLTTVNLEDAHTDTTPSGSELRWFTNDSHTGTALTLAQIATAGAGTYYAFYYDSNGVYSPASAAVTVTIDDCPTDPCAVLSVDLQPYNGQTNTTQIFTNNVIGIGDARMTVTHQTFGNGALSTDRISDSHFAGEYGINLGHSSGNTKTFDNRIETTLNFSAPVKDLKLTLNDIDAGDHIRLMVYDHNNNLVIISSSNYTLYPNTVVLFQNVAGSSGEFYEPGIEDIPSNDRRATVDLSFAGIYISKVVFQYYDPDGSGTYTITKFSGIDSTNCPDCTNSGITSVNLNSLYTGTSPTDVILEWWTSPTRNSDPLNPGTKVTDPANVTASGTYYAFFYDTANLCYNTNTSTSSVVVKILPPCTCVWPGNFLEDGIPTKIGITVQQKLNGWPENIPNGFIALESKTKGFVITRVGHVGNGTNGAANSMEDDIETAREGMLVYDIQDKCIKLYNGEKWKCIEKSCNTQEFTLSCSDVVIAGDTIGPDVNFTITLPYANGNGTPYAGQIVQSMGVLGLTATVSSGTLANGDSSIIISVSGTASHNGGAGFEININGHVCHIIASISSGGGGG